MLEATQVVCFAVLTAQLRTRVTANWQLLGVIVLFPCTFFGANFGAGWPVIIALHTEGTSTALITAGTLAAIGLAVVLIAMAAALIPKSSGGDSQHRMTVLGQRQPSTITSA